MTKFLMTAAMLAVVGSSAGAQTAQFSAAKAAAQKAVNAENQHTAAMQQPERAMSGPSAAPAKPQPQAQQQGAPRAARVTSRPQANAVHAANETSAPPADTGTAPIVIMREQFDYARDGRRDPFYSLITTSELRPTMSDLRLTGILFDQNGGHSVATLRDVLSDQQYRVTTGTQLGRMRVSVIRLKSIVFTIDEFGATRQDSLILGDTTQVRKR